VNEVKFQRQIHPRPSNPGQNSFPRRSQQRMEDKSPISGVKKEKNEG
jgi:hypothetical protein